MEDNEGQYVTASCETMVHSLTKPDEIWRTINVSILQVLVN